MEASHTPELNLLHTGATFKTLKVTALKGAVMPLHHATSEAVLIVQEGEAVLKMNGEKHILDKNASIIIPAFENHSLEIISDFNALVVMAVDSDIQFQS